ncbi:MAG: hypothetical protein IJO65_01510 [Lachnospiraceae bacterium]|nr:hypothetical protein [Lachnospiraceae bacterium]
MTLFLFLKQIVDMLYQYRILDYIMVIWVVLLLLYQVALVRPDIRKNVTLADGIVLLLGTLLTVNFVRSQSGYEIYFKVMSAFLMYFVGRIYYDRIKECYGALVTASYFIVYVSLAERIHRFGFALGTVRDAGGGFYFYDTDLAFAMILAMVFIAMFGKNSVFKLITIFIVCPYMVIFSDAGIQVMLMFAVYAVIAIYVMELIFRKKKMFNYLLTIIVLGLIAIVIFIYLPVFGVDNNVLMAKIFDGHFLNSSSMNDRYAAWQEALNEIEKSGIAGRLFGVGMGAEITIRSLYIKIFYSMGTAGLLLSAMLIVAVMYYVTKVDDRKTFYLAVIMAVVLLGTGVTVNSMESTQMSWFPLLFAGMVVSSAQEEKDEQLLQEE